MRHPKLATLVVAASIVTLAACNDPPTSTPDARVARSTATAITLTCDINGLKAGARAYAASKKDPLFTIIGDLQQLVKNGPSAAGTDKAFDGLARLAAMRGTNAQLGTAAGDSFNGLTVGFLGCMDASVTSGVPGDFSVAGALGAGWMYEVRGGAGDAADGAYERGESPYWAAEASGGWSAASTSPVKRYLVYGYRLQDFLANDPKVGSAFEVGTLPTIASGQLKLGSSLLIGQCDVDLTNNTLRVQHVSTVLTLRELTCGAAPSFSSVSRSDADGSFSPLRLAQRAVAFFAPRELNAAMRLGSVGGAVSELSPSVVIDMQSVDLLFMKPIADGRTRQALADASGNPVQVMVATHGGTPLPGVIVTLSIAGNSSSIAFFRDGSAAPSATVSRTTGTDGLVTFDNVFLTKAGGYTIVASGGFDGVAAAPFASNLFNMQNK